MKGKKVLILGTGGASKTAHALAEFMGAKSVDYVSRSGKGGSITYEQAVQEHNDAQIIINATPAACSRRSRATDGHFIVPEA